MSQGSSWGNFPSIPKNCVQKPQNLSSLENFWVHITKYFEKWKLCNMIIYVATYDLVSSKYIIIINAGYHKIVMFWMKWIIVCKNIHSKLALQIKEHFFKVSTFIRCFEFFSSFSFPTYTPLSEIMSLLLSIKFNY